jgi:dsRNA-specific ribonuclease
MRKCVEKALANAARTGQANRELQTDASNEKLATEARQKGLDQVIVPGASHNDLTTHQKATQVEAVVGAVWIDSNRNWDAIEKCYRRIKS